MKLLSHAQLGTRLYLAGLLHGQMTSDLACLSGRSGRMASCLCPIPPSFVMTLCASRGTVSPE